MEGTPLKKFGPYQVRQSRRGKTFGTFHLYDQDGQRVLFSFHKGSIYLAAEKLASGKPIQTPQEARDHSVRTYALIYPSRFSWYNQTYAVIGNGLEWINGGLVADDVTSLTPEGAEINNRMEDPKGRWKTPLPEEEANIRAYLDGTWPEFGGRGKLYPLHDPYSCLGEMALRVTRGEEFDPLWVEDARTAALMFWKVVGVDQSSVNLLLKWCHTLEKKYGGQWFLPAGPTV